MIVRLFLVFVVSFLIVALGLLPTTQAALIDDGKCDNRCRQRYDWDHCGSLTAGVYTGRHTVQSNCALCVDVGPRRVRKVGMISSRGLPARPLA